MFSQVSHVFANFADLWGLRRYAGTDIAAGCNAACKRSVWGTYDGRKGEDAHDTKAPRLP